MQIHGLNKTTLLDYPGRVAATVFTGACNFRCPFCHNGDLVLHPEEQPLIPEAEFFEFLQKRKGILTGVCISGGEPTLQSDLPVFLSRIKKLDYKIKLDTNGYLPEVLVNLCREHLVDYIAMDIKSGQSGYSKACGLPALDFSLIKESVNMIRNCGLPYEFRTTVVKELHQSEDFAQIGKLLHGCNAYFLQSYKESEQVLLPGFHACSKEELLSFAAQLRPDIPNTALRGID